jgi:hypothetical protein
VGTGITPFRLARSGAIKPAQPTNQGDPGGGGGDRNPTESPAVACLIDGLWLRQLEQRS